MLRELSVRNFALLEEVDLHFEPGLNVLTGETGAGKSIIIDAIGTVLGGRASSEVIRAGAERATIQAHFTLDREDAGTVTALLRDAGLERDGATGASAEITLTREIGRSGRSVARIDGRTVS